MLRVDDTIAALATASGGALRGVVRVSGPQVLACLRSCFRSDRDDWPRAARPIVVGGLIPLGPPCGDVPADLYLWPTRRSYTCQPTAELHTLGSPPILEAVLRAVCRAGARLAEPGEFTLRAFLAGRLDLTQAEAVLGVIDARDRQQLDVALAQLGGNLATPLHQLRQQLLDLLAHLEAGLDFVDEDIEFITKQQLEEELAQAAAAVAALRRQMESRVATTDEPRVVLIGLPNVGKSSLLNALTGEQAAIVSAVEGTTRDYVARHVRWGHVGCVLVDTAGVESPTTSSDLAAAAQGMRLRQQEQADLLLVCIDGTREPGEQELSLLSQTSSARRLIVRTRCDLGPPTPLAQPSLPTSSLTGAGIRELRQAILEAVLANRLGTVASTAARCHESLRLAEQSLANARALTEASSGEEFVAAEVRHALDELGKVAGTVYTDDILDRVFSRFCIGK